MVTLRHSQVTFHIVMTTSMLCFGKSDIFFWWAGNVVWRHKPKNSCIDESGIITPPFIFTSLTAHQSKCLIFNVFMLQGGRGRGAQAPQDPLFMSLRYKRTQQYPFMCKRYMFDWTPSTPKMRNSRNLYTELSVAKELWREAYQRSYLLTFYFQVQM